MIVIRYFSQNKFGKLIRPKTLSEMFDRVQNMFLMQNVNHCQKVAEN